jgi:hypothetical protein
MESWNFNDITVTIMPIKLNLKAKDFTPYSPSISEIERFYSSILLINWLQQNTTKSNLFQSDLTKSNGLYKKVEDLTRYNIKIYIY